MVEKMKYIVSFSRFDKTSIFIYFSWNWETTYPRDTKYVELFNTLCAFGDISKLVLVRGFRVISSIVHYIKGNKFNPVLSTIYTNSYRELIYYTTAKNNTIIPTDRQAHLNPSVLNFEKNEGAKYK